MTNCETHCLQISVISCWLISATPSPNHSHLHLSNFPALQGASFILNIWFFFFLPLPTIRLLWDKLCFRMWERSCLWLWIEEVQRKQLQDRAWFAGTEGGMNSMYHSKRKENSAAFSKGAGNPCNQRYVNKQALKSYLLSFQLGLQSASPPKLSYQTYLAHLCWWM